MNICIKIKTDNNGSECFAVIPVTKSVRCAMTIQKKPAASIIMVTLNLALVLCPTGLMPLSFNTPYEFKPPLHYALSFLAQ
jgi:hypothetical protein